MTNDSDTLVQYSHRSLWTALVLLLVLAAWAVAANLFPDHPAAAMAGKAAGMLPIAIVFAVVAMRRSMHGLKGDPSSPAMKAVLNDELRQQSMQRACRNGLVAVLLALLFTLTALPQPVPLMAALTLLTGVATVLASVLAYDR